MNIFMNIFTGPPPPPGTNSCCSIIAYQQNTADACVS